MINLFIAQVSHTAFMGLYVAVWLYNVQDHISDIYSWTDNAS